MYFRDLGLPYWPFVPIVVRKNLSLPRRLSFGAKNIIVETLMVRSRDECKIDLSQH